MPTYEVTSPDGKTWEVTAPDGATQDQVLNYAKQQWAAQVKELPAAVKAGQAISGIPRQLGLTARYALEGLPAFADVVASPARVALNAMGANFKPLTEAGTDVANSLGLPKPVGANERVIGDMTRMGFGAVGMGGPLNSVAARASGVPSKVASLLAANPVQQAGAAVGAGGAAGAVREAGGGPVSQAVGGLVGSVAGGFAGSGIEGISKAISAGLRPQMKAQEVEQQIQLVLRGSGIDWNALPERVKQGMRAEVASAMNTGADLNPDAVRRLVSFKATGTTPTRGMLTQDPVQITREQNLARVGANSTDMGLQQLPALQNRNAASLLRNLDDLGARGAPDAYTAGQRAVGAVSADLSRARGVVDSLYQQARDTSGRSAQLDGAAFASNVNKALDDALLGYAVPKSVENKLNQIALGEVPFNVDFAEQLKTVIGNIGAAGKGDATTKAMGIIRRELDNTPLRGAGPVKPGNLPAVPGMIPRATQAELGQESITAFNRARQANRGLMQRVESSPALEAVYRGLKEGQPVDPDNFVKRFIVGQGASVADVRSLQRSFAADPAARDAVKQYIAAHLKSAATSGTEDITKFSSSAFARALDSIGERKLSAFFTPEEIAQLDSVKKAATLMQAQPVGTAVNNSNSGVFLAAKTLEILDAVSGKLPLGLDSMIQGTVRGVQQRQVMNTPAALTVKRPSNALVNIGLPPLLAPNLLAAPAIDNR